jgi:arylsulfatase A-like enzyme
MFIIDVPHTGKRQAAMRFLTIGIVKPPSHRSFVRSFAAAWRVFLWIDLLIAIVLVLGHAPDSTVLAQHRDYDEGQAGVRPNIIFIITDDQNADMITYMPILQAQLAAKGVTFSNAYTVSPLCCPARASVLRGQYVHNHQVFSNSGKFGGFKRFKSRGLEKSTVATWLQAAGYRTALVGKYLNTYAQSSQNHYIPRGWDEWYGWWYSNKGKSYYTRFAINENGHTVNYGAHQPAYMTDVLSAKSVDFITRSLNDNVPFFLYLAPLAPHGPYIPAPRHATLFNDLPLPKPPSFNEGDVSDKPQRIRKKPLLNDEDIQELEQVYRNQLRTLQAVDEMIGAIVATLDVAGQLENTYIVFTTDNGYHYGAHRLMPSKGNAYTEDVRIPLVIRGPGVPQGVTIDRLVANIDFAPTFGQIAAAQVPSFVNGRSLLPLIEATDPASYPWRQSIVVTMLCPNYDQLIKSWNVNKRCFNMLRTATLAYVDYPALKTREYYDLVADPFQLDNLAATLYEPEQIPLSKRLSKHLGRLLKCKRDECRILENETIP